MARALLPDLRRHHLGRVLRDPAQHHRRAGPGAAPPLSARRQEAGRAAANHARADKDRLNALGLDLTEHAGQDYVEVVLHTAEDLATLTAAGFTYDVRIAAMLARQQERIALDRAYAAANPTSPLPSAEHGDLAKRISIARASRAVT